MKLFKVLFVFLLLVINVFSNQNIHDKQLLKASHENNTTKITVLIKKGANVNCANKNGWTPLHTVAQYKHLKIAELLIDNGAKINIQKTNGSTPLMVALSNKNYLISDFFIKSNANLTIKNKNGETVLKYAIKNQNLDLVKLFLEKGLDVNEKDNEGWTPLHVAAQYDNLEMVQYLIDNGAKINEQKNNGSTPLMVAVSNKQKNMIQLLIINDADINIKNNYGKTPLSIAKQKSLVKSLTKNYDYIDSLMCTNLLDKKSIKGKSYCLKSAQKYELIQDNAQASWYYLLGGDLNKTIITSKKAIENNKLFAYSNLGHANFILGNKKKAVLNYVNFFLSDNKSQKYFDNDIKYLNIIYDKKIIRDMKFEWKYFVIKPTYISIDEYKKIAKNNNTIAYKLLGYYYFKDKVDLKLSKYYFKLALKSEDKDILKMIDFINLELDEINDIDKMYQYAKYLESIYDKNSYKWYEKSAQLGNIRAQKYLAKYYWQYSYINYQIYKEDKNIIDNAKRALFWNELLANNKYISSQIRLIQMYSSDLYFKKDIAKAKIWSNKFSKNKDFLLNNVKDLMQRILFEKTILQATKDGLIDSVFWIHKYAEHIHYKDIEEAIIWYKKAANNNFFKSQLKLAKIYERKDDLQNALIWYKKSFSNSNLLNKCKNCEHKIEELSILTGKLKDDSLYTKYADKYYKYNHYEKSLKLYKYLHKKGDISATYKIGLIYKLQKDYLLAKEYFLNAAEKDYVDACFSLHEMYSDTKYGFNNIKQKDYWSKKANNLQLLQQTYKNKVLNAIHDKKYKTIDSLIKLKNQFSFEFICEAVKDGSLDIVKLLVNKSSNIDFNKKCPKYLNSKVKGKSLIYIASQYGYENIVDYLLLKKVILKVNKNYTPLRIALINGNNNISKKLIDKNSSLELPALVYAYNDNNLNILKQLNKESLTSAFNASSYKIFTDIIKEGKNDKYFIYKDENEELPLFAEKYIEFALKYNYKIVNKEKLFKKAMELNNRALINILIKDNVNVDKYNSTFSMIVDDYYSNFQVVENILRVSKNPLKLIHSVYKQYGPTINNPKIIKLFLKYGLNVNYNSYVLSSTTNFEVIKILINNGLKITKNSSVILNVIKSKKPYDKIIQELKFLIKNGANVNVMSLTKMNAVSILLSKPNIRNLKIVKYLSMNGLDFELKNFNNSTIFHDKILSRDSKTVKFLLDIGKKLTLKDFYVAIENNRIDIFDLLLKYNKTIKLEILLKKTVYLGSYNMSKNLINKGAIVNEKSTLGKEIIKNAYINKLDFIYKHLSLETVNKLIQSQGVAN